MSAALDIKCFFDLFNFCLKICSYSLLGKIFYSGYKSTCIVIYECFGKALSVHCERWCQ